ncbi:phosphomevalonate kinase [Streptococcus dentasini]
MTKYSVQTGGKLYIAGEYAILTPGQVALIKHIPIYMSAEIESASRYQLSSDMFGYIADMTPDSSYALIQETITVANSFLVSQGLKPHPFALTVSGKMEKEGKKIGIGSSGSVTLLVLKAMAALYHQDWSEELLFKLAAYTLLKRGDNGSMGDLACIAYENLILFTSFDRSQIRSWIETADLGDVLKRDWGYRIEPIKTALNCDFLVGWTKKPAISANMINQVKSAITPRFLEQTQAAVMSVAEGLKVGDKGAIKEQLQRVSQLLKDLHPAIYTQELLNLEAAAENLDAVAKSSGAGGGDCGIALSFDEVHSCILEKQWREKDIEILHREKW